LVDTFPDCFSFHLVNQKDTSVRITYHKKLNSIYEDSLINQDIILIILDISIKNNIATLISNIYKEEEIIAKIVHHTMNVMFTETELFTIRCGINHTT